MKLVKNTKHIKFPRAADGVQPALRRAMQKAAEQKWRHVIIIGASGEVTDYACTPMSLHLKYGLLEVGKDIVRDEHG